MVKQLVTNVQDREVCGHLRYRAPALIWSVTEFGVLLAAWKPNQSNLEKSNGTIQLFNMIAGMKIETRW